MKGFTGELEFTLTEITRRIAPLEAGLKEAEKEELRRLIDEDVPESVRFISASVDKMDTMLTAILRISRLGRRVLEIEPIDLHKLCRIALSTLDFQIRKTGTEVTLGELPVIDNDRLVIEQILGNLIGNAIKYLSPERSGKVHIWSESNAQGITIFVEDNGRGIADEEKEKVFQIFRRGRHSDVAGEGMGLAYVQTMVRAQNGSISYTSVENEGSTFTVYLPFIKSEA